ncbi:MAG: spermidine synthase [Gammaproteobacteria bacterium]|jgi:spermidine synthase
MSNIGKEIFRTYDEYGLLQVIDDGNKRFLSFGEDDEQSCHLKSGPHQLQHDYTQAMLLVLLFCQPKKAILFGLGGGCLATCLHYHFPELKLRVVELRRAVVKLAYRYFQFPKSKRIEVFTQDVGEFVDEDHKKADVIFSDIYGSDGLDMQQAQPWFIERCSELLATDGWLVLNCWKQHRSENEMFDSLKDYFADVRVCATADGNWIVFAGKKLSTESATQLKQSAKNLSKTLGYSLTSHLARLNVV